MKELIVGNRRKENLWGSHKTPNSLIRLRGDNVTLKIPVQKPSDKEEIIENTLKNVQERISQMSADRLSNAIDLIVRAVEGRAVVGARTGADRKLLVIQEIKEEIGKINVFMTQEQNEKMQNFYQDLIIALQEKQGSVYDALNPAQIAKLQAAQNTK